MAVRKFLDNNGAAQLNTLLTNKFASKRNISDGDIIKIINQNSVRIWDLEAGIYKLPESCSIYYRGSSSTSILSAYGGLLIVTDYEGTNGIFKYWWLLRGNGSSLHYSTHGYTKETDGSYSNDLTSISSYVKNNLTYSTSTTSYALSAYQGYILNQNKADKTELPTKISDLDNDSNFVEDSSYVHTDSNFTSEEKTKLSGIESGAQENNIDSITVNGTEQLPDANKNVSLDVPKITYGTTDLTPGTSELPTGSYYFVYE